MRWLLSLQPYFGIAEIFPKWTDLVRDHDNYTSVFLERDRVIGKTKSVQCHTLAQFVQCKISVRKNKLGDGKIWQFLFKHNLGLH